MYFNIYKTGYICYSICKENTMLTPSLIKLKIRLKYKQKKTTEEKQILQDLEYLDSIPKNQYHSMSEDCCPICGKYLDSYEDIRKDIG